MVSKQQNQILKILKDLGSVSANDIETAYNNRNDGNISNVYAQLNRLIGKGFVNRIEDEYELSERGDKLLSDGEEAEEVKGIVFSKEEKEKIKEFSDNPLPKVMKSIRLRAFPDILGLEDAKDSCLASAVSMEDKGHSRNRVSILLYGAKGTSKSTLMDTTVELVNGYIADKTGSKEAGLRGTAKGSEFTEGKLQKADRSVLGIDEISRYDRKEQESLFRAISKGTVEIDLDQVCKPTDTRVRVIGTSNNIGGLLGPLVDRFDIKVQVRELSEEEKEELLNTRAQDWNREPGIDRRFVKKYLKYARNFETKLTENREEVVKVISDNVDSLEDFTPRMIEAIFRVSLAFARLHLKDTVQDVHVEKAVKLVKENNF